MEVLERHQAAIRSTGDDANTLNSNGVLDVLRGNLVELGFEVEAGKRADQKISRPVFFGDNGAPTLQYEVDAYNPGWRCGLEVEAGRAWKGNAIYRDLIQAMVMVEVEHLILCVRHIYRYKGGVSPDYKNTCDVAEALYGHSRIAMPYGLVVVGASRPC